MAPPVTTTPSVPADRAARHRDGGTSGHRSSDNRPGGRGHRRDRDPARWRRLPRWPRRRAEVSARREPDRPPPRTPVRGVRRPPRADRRPRRLGPGGEGRRVVGAEAQSQQVESVVVPGSRGTILDRTGRELAVSEDAATIFATPYQVKDPEETAHKLAEDPRRRPRTMSSRSLADRDSGFAYIARKVDLAAAERDPKARPARDRDAPRQPPDLPAGRARLAGDRHGRDRQPGPDRARGRRGRASCTGPTASARWSATRSATSSSATRSTARRPAPT